VLANNRIEFLDFHLVRHGALVLVGGIEVACVGAGYQFDLVSHDWLPVVARGKVAALDLNSAFTDVSQHRIDAEFVDYTHTLGGQAQFDEAIFRFNPEAVGMNIRREPTSGSVFRV
jgi:hypothetical protein